MGSPFWATLRAWNGWRAPLRGYGDAPVSRTQRPPPHSTLCDSFGVPDYKQYPTTGPGALPSANQLQDPAVLAVAAAHGATPAQVILAWQWALGVPTNPRSMSAQHMADNLAAYAITLNQTEVHMLSTRPQDLCSVDASWYECAGGSGPKRRL